VFAARCPHATSACTEQRPDLLHHGDRHPWV